MKLTSSQMPHIQDIFPGAQNPRSIQCSLGGVIRAATKYEKLHPRRIFTHFGVYQSNYQNLTSFFWFQVEYHSQSRATSRIVFFNASDYAVLFYVRPLGCHFLMSLLLLCKNLYDHTIGYEISMYRKSRI